MRVRAGSRQPPRAAGGLTGWQATTTFRKWPNVEPKAHEFNCRKGDSPVVGADNTMSAAEVEVARRFCRSGWKAGWLATCGRSNPAWRKLMLAVNAPAASRLPVPLPLVPAKIAAVLVRNGAAGYPDVVAWQREREPVFVELKGPDDKGIGQVEWLRAALGRGDLKLDHFLLLKWTLEP